MHPYLKDSQLLQTWSIQGLPFDALTLKCWYYLIMYVICNIHRNVENTQKGKFAHTHTLHMYIYKYSTHGFGI